MYRIHLIAIGGSIMHNLALTLHKKGYRVSGSDDQIFEPARSRLLAAGLLPEPEGWQPQKISNEIDLIILGMHAKKDNPELLRAIELGIRIQSFPEYIAHQYKEKKQIVVTGSHGKTTTAAMLIHAFRLCNLKVDYLVGAQLAGFEDMVTITDAPLAIIEGDEYLSSCLDSQPKFMHYNPYVNIITGIAWDHYNVFPTMESYISVFEQRVAAISPKSHLVYYEGDNSLKELVSKFGNHLHLHPYKEADYAISDETVFIKIEKEQYPLQVFGKHNLQNIQAVIETGKILGLNPVDIAKALTNFKGAAKRMELVSKNEKQIRYRDFAHAPSKVKATLDAFREKYPSEKILAVLELHTYSSLNKEFLPQYKNAVDHADQTIIYYDQKTLELKRMPVLDSDFIKSSFDNNTILVSDNIDTLKQYVQKFQNDFQVVLFLGSGQFGGLDLKES